MLRTNIMELKPNKAQSKMLKECMLLSSCVYNMTNYIVRQQIINKQEVSSFYDLQKELQVKEDYKRLGRSYALPRIQVYGETNSARFKLIKSKSQDKVGLPKYLKNRKTNTTLPSYLVIDNCQYSIGSDKVKLPLSRQMRKEYGIKDFSIRYNGIPKWEGNQKMGQIHFKDGKFYLYQSIEVNEPTKAKSDVYASIDMGIKEMFGLKLSNDEDRLIGSKRHFRQWKYYEDKIAEERSRLTLQHNKLTSNRLQKLYRMRTKWQNNLQNNLVSKAFRIMHRNQVSYLFVGDVKGIREGRGRHSRTANQMLHNYWAYDSLYHKLENKSEEYGIEMVRIGEEYTSQTCPICTIESYPKDRIFVCDYCGHFDHRDIVGATNILSKGMHSLRERVHRCEEAPLGVA